MIEKSSRHQKILGNFGEYLVCNWLSRSGFEVCVVDHTGLDIVAYSRSTRERFGITVKSRTRRQGTETDSVYIFRDSKADRRKLLEACEAFNAKPWIAVYAECEKEADLFLTSLDNYDQKYRPSDERAVDGWTMTPKQRLAYAQDPEVKHIQITFSVSSNWWQPNVIAAAATS
jgi:Holliday junction resolvase-like predicted endonuclease